MTFVPAFTHLNVSTVETNTTEESINTRTSTMGIVHIIIASFGMLTNLMVIVVFLNHRKLRRKTPNICIINQVSSES